MVTATTQWVGHGLLGQATPAGMGGGHGLGPGLGSGRSEGSAPCRGRLAPPPGRQGVRFGPRWAERLGSGGGKGRIPDGSWAIVPAISGTGGVSGSGGVVRIVRGGRIADMKSNAFGNFMPGHPGIAVGYLRQRWTYPGGAGGGSGFFGCGGRGILTVGGRIAGGRGGRSCFGSRLQGMAVPPSVATWSFHGGCLPPCKAAKRLGASSSWVAPKGAGVARGRVDARACAMAIGRWADYEPSHATRDRSKGPSGVDAVVNDRLCSKPTVGKPISGSND